jgi:hypothetical protein
MCDDDGESRSVRDLHSHIWLRHSVTQQTYRKNNEKRQQKTRIKI